MDRNQMLDILQHDPQIWDLVVVGGGATGVGAAIDAASRGYKVLLVEAYDFGKGTSSRSTKLVHGGVRYLQQGDIPLVLEALRERGIMKQNAPHLVKDQEFVVPVYSWWQAAFYLTGLKLYDLLSWKLSFGISLFLSKKKVIQRIPEINAKGLKGGILYHDGQFDDSRMLINMVQTAVRYGAVLLNYMQLINYTEEGGITHLQIKDAINQKEYQVDTRGVINATGVFSDSIRLMANPDTHKIMTSSQGVHIVLEKSFLSGTSAIMVPRTDDGRVLFAVPWHNKVIVGTTDTPVKSYPLEPIAQEDEITFLLSHAGRYLVREPKRDDVLSVFTGLRPLVSNSRKKNTKSISRTHYIERTSKGMLTIAGGKWTTYRKMALDVVNTAIKYFGLEKQKCHTKDIRIQSVMAKENVSENFNFYGSDALEIQKLMKEKEEYAVLLHPHYAIYAAQVVWACKREMALTVEDFLARRIRLLFIDVQASLDIAPKVAEIMANCLKKDSNWINSQINSFTQTAEAFKL